jgi:PAS domain-containing protein
MTDGGYNVRASRPAVPATCAWCHRPVAEDVDAPVSNGICADCMIDLEFRREPLRQFLNRLAGPVLAVTDEGRVVGANTGLAGMVQADVRSVEGKLGGEVMSCIYAELPGGCGHTVHCNGCTIRQSFEHTRKSGQPLRDVSAFAWVRQPEGPVRKAFLVSTERLGELVLVRLEAV